LTPIATVRSYPSFPDYRKEVSLMFAVAVAKNISVRCARALGRAVKSVMELAPSATTAAAGAVRDSLRSRSDLIAENALLRQQLIVVIRSVGRPALRRGDRLALLLLARVCRRWRDTLHLVQPDTLLRWHRDLFKIVWRRKSRRKSPSIRLPQETIEQIQAMAKENALWGAERIRGELLKLGLPVSKRTIQRYMKRARPPGKRSQNWGTFFENHAGDIWACDFLQLYDVLFRPIFAFFLVKHGTREVVHFNVTRSPNDRWAAQQLREATPHCEGPRYLIRDNDDKFGGKFTAVADGTGIAVVRIPPRSPNLNPICERFLGSVRRECLDHVVILNEDHLRRVLGEYIAAYFNPARPHQGLGQRIPGRNGTPSAGATGGRIAATPVLGGLHHDYRWAA
jgi:transposase InsO family protein